MIRRNLSESGINLLLAATNKEMYLRFRKQICFDKSESVHQLIILRLLVTGCRQYYVTVNRHIIIASKRME
jgi:hypothetical protein